MPGVACHQTRPTGKRNRRDHQVRIRDGCPVAAQSCLVVPEQQRTGQIEPQDRQGGQELGHEGSVFIRVTRIGRAIGKLAGRNPGGSNPIDKMLEMQKEFIEYEHNHGVTGKDYWASSEGLLVDYRQEYMDMANRVVDIAHEVVGSSRN